MPLHDFVTTFIKITALIYYYGYVQRTLKAFKIYFPKIPLSTPLHHYTTATRDYFMTTWHITMNICFCAFDYRIKYKNRKTTRFNTIFFTKYTYFSPEQTEQTSIWYIQSNSITLVGFPLMGVTRRRRV